MLLKVSFILIDLMEFALQMSLVGNPIGLQPLPRQQQQQQQAQHFQQFPQHLQHSQQQQQWVEAQRKAAEDQKKLYDQMMKQRHFDEQKMRLKAFNASKKVSKCNGI